MIKSLSILNFQSHKKTDLEFDPGVNIIVGPSDSGKTAIIRALRWIIWNRPQGDGMRSHWGGSTEVELTIDGETLSFDPTITRLKGKQEEYIVNGESLKAFKTEVPESVQQVLNINEINLQRQLDMPFLLSSTPGEVAQHFNKVAKLDKIDTALQRVNGWIRELLNSTKYGEDQEKSLSEELKKFDYLEKFEVDVEVLEEIEKQWLSVTLGSNSLDKLIRSIKHNEVLISNEKALLDLESPVDSILQLISEVKTIYDAQFSLFTITRNIAAVDEQIEFYNQVINYEEITDKLLGLYSNKNEITAQYNKLDKLSKSISTIGTYIDMASNKVIQLEEKFDALFPDICPLCGKPK